MVCVEDQRKKIVLEKLKVVERQLNDMVEETSKLEDRVTAALVICEEHMSNYHTLLELMSSKTWAKNSRKEIAKSLGRSGCTLAMFRSGNRFTERRWRVDYKKVDDEVWNWWKNTDGETNTKRSLMETTDETRPKSESRVVQFTNGAAQGGARTCPSATDSVHFRVWWKDKFFQFRVFRNCGRSAKRNTTIGWSMLLSWCIGFFSP